MERLYRSRDDRVISGVAGGLAEAIDVDPSVVRVAWVILTVLSGGLLFLVYVVMAIVVPQEPFRGSYPAAGMPGTGVGVGPAPADPTEPAVGTAPAGPQDAAEAQWREARRLERQRLRAERRAQGGGFPLGAVVGLVLVLVGAAFLAQRFFPRLDFDLIWPVLVVGLGAALIVGSVRRGGDRSDPSDPGGPGVSS